MESSPELECEEPQPPLENIFPPQRGSSVYSDDYRWLIEYASTASGECFNKYEMGVPRRCTLAEIATNCQRWRSHKYARDQEKAIKLIQKLTKKQGGHQTFKTIGVSIATAKTVAEVHRYAQLLWWYSVHTESSPYRNIGRRGYSLWLRGSLCRRRRKHLEEHPLCKDTAEWMYKKTVGFPFLRLPLELREQVYSYLLPPKSPAIEKPNFEDLRFCYEENPYADVPAVSLVNRQISAEFRSLLFKQRSFHAAIYCYRRYGLQVWSLGIEVSPKYLRDDNGFLARIENWELSLKILVDKFKPEYWQSRSLRDRRCRNGPCQSWPSQIKTAANAMSEFCVFLRAKATATRNLFIKIIAGDPLIPPDILKYVLEPLSGLSGLERVRIGFSDSLWPGETTTHVANNVSALVECGWNADDLRVSQEWSYLKEAARRSLFVRDV